MVTTTPPQHLLGQIITGRAADAFAAWADANQKILRELVDLSAGAAKEGVRLYAELQSSTVEAVKDGNAFLLRRQSAWQEAPGDPLGCYQKSVLDSVEATQKMFKLLEGNAQAMTRSAERLQATAEQASKEVQSAFAEVAAKMKSLSSPLA